MIRPTPLLLSALLLSNASFAWSQAPTPGKTEVLIPKSKGKKKKPKKIPYAQRINLNGASREELMKVPTIDAQTADKIIAGRPYKTTGELLIRNIVPGAHFWTIKEKVTAGPTGPKKPAATSGKVPAKK